MHCFCEKYSYNFKCTTEGGCKDATFGGTVKAIIKVGTLNLLDIFDFGHSNRCDCGHLRKGHPSC